MNNFSHNITSTYSFDKSVRRLLSLIEKNAFTVLHIHDIQQTFASKGIKHDGYQIIEFCRAPIAKKVLDRDPLIGLFLPCKAIIYEKDEKANISLMSPKITSHFFQDSLLKDIALQIDNDIKNIISQFQNT